MTDKQPALFDWATELSDAQGHVTLSEQEAHEIGARLRRLHSENETLQAGHAAARLEIESLQARIKIMAEEHADELMVAHLDGRMRAAQPAGAQQPAKAESLRQILTDPENQPNQYGVQFLMHGAKMAFRIGNRQFCLDYEPDEPGEFEFMRDALISAFSIFTPDVKLAQQPSPTPQADSQPAPQQEAQYNHGPQAETVAEAARDVGKWLNERPNRPIDLRHVAMLCAHAQAQAAQEPVAWYVTGCSRLLDEDEAKAEARRIGGTARAMPLYTAPQVDSQPAPVREEEREAFKAAHYADFDRWALCTIDEVPLPKTLAEFRAAVTRLLAEYKEPHHG